MIRAYQEYWEGYFDFRGTTSRGGYWWAFLANYITAFVLAIISGVLSGGRQETAMTIPIAFMLLGLLPSLAIMVRRLRDAGCGWPNVFWALLPIAGAVILIVKLCKPSSGETYKAVVQPAGASGAPVYQTYARPATVPVQAVAPPVQAAAPVQAAPPVQAAALVQAVAPPVQAAAPVQAAPPIQAAPPVQAAGGSILDQYRAGRAFLDVCGAFDERKYHDFNRITGNRFAAAEIENQISKAKLLPGGMEEVRKILRSTMTEGIQAFETLERSGIDLSAYNI